MKGTSSLATLPSDLIRKKFFYAGFDTVNVMLRDAVFAVIIKLHKPFL